MPYLIGIHSSLAEVRHFPRPRVFFHTALIHQTLTPRLSLCVCVRQRARSAALEDVVILNVDTNILESPHEDLKKIPADVVRLWLLADLGLTEIERLRWTLSLQVAGLKVRLKRQAASAGSGVAHAFLRAQALLFGGYRDALQSPAVSDTWHTWKHHLEFSKRLRQCSSLVCWRKGQWCSATSCFSVISLKACGSFWRARFTCSASKR